VFNPTQQQIEILKCNSNCVVAAGPGSGKTTTLAHKINEVLGNLRWYQGVIAISYTNKASDELKRKSNKLSDDLKNSAFSTIDSFCISNILIPFGKHFFGIPKQKMTVDKSRVEAEVIQEIKYFLEQLVSQHAEMSIAELVEKDINPLEHIRKRDFELIARLFKDGFFDLRILGHISYLIFISSKSCRDYITSRYKYVFIDEFQDSGLEQYLLFLRLAESGLVSWAIGDVNQSIFGFAEKSAEYLFRLMDNSSFVKLPMDINHRCHPSIDYYSKKLLNFDVEYSGESKVFDLYVNGNESSIGDWLTNEITNIKQAFSITNNCEVGVLAKTERTLELFTQRLHLPYKLHIKTPFDSNQTSWGALFQELLHVSFGNKVIYDFIDSIFERDSLQAKSKISELKHFLIHCKDIVPKFKSGASHHFDEICDTFSRIAHLTYPESSSDSALRNLQEVLSEERFLNVFSPPESNQIQLMTLHKSKGLEFDVVIHLDLYQFIIPGYDWVVKGIKREFYESRNLHYVGITRAKKALFLPITENRFISKTQTFDTAKPSEFLFIDGIEVYRTEWKP
jgi:superfamily I DNA/RNA helicase